MQKYLVYEVRRIELIKKRCNNNSTQLVLVIKRNWKRGIIFIHISFQVQKQVKMNERGPDFLQWVCTPSLGKITSHRDSQFTVDKGEDKIFPSEGVTAPLKIHGAPLIHHLKFTKRVYITE